jgi:hypothetical protein
MLDLILVLCFSLVVLSYAALCKQTLVAMSTNHLEIISLYEVACECAWLQRKINHI